MNGGQTTDAGEPGPTRRRDRSPRGHRLLAPIAIALAVVLVLGGVATTLAILGDHGPQSPAGNGNGSATPVPPGGVLKLQSMLLAGPAYGPLRLGGTLPSHGPRRGVTYALPDGRAPAQLVHRLAHALGLPAPRHVGDAWIAHGKGALRVADAPGWPWTYTSARIIGGGLPGCAQADRRHGRPGIVSCAIEPRSGRSAQPRLATPAQPAKLPPRAAGAVHRLLVALGEQNAAMAVHGSGGYVTVTVRRTVAGLPVAGFDSDIVVSGARVSSATGWLAGTARPLAASRSYPLLDARQAYQRALHAPTGMHPDLCVMRPGPRRAECVGGQPRLVTGAGAGLGMARTANGGALLVPAWLFTLGGHGAGDVLAAQGPLAVVAVAGDHVQAPAGLPAQLRGSGG